MGNIEEEEKDMDNVSTIDDHAADEDSFLDGKRLHDLYRHTTRLIK